LIEGETEIDNTLLKGQNSRKKAKNAPLEEIRYDVDDYDKVRMQLLFENELFYRNFKETKKELENNIKYQPRKREMPCCYNFGILMLELVIIALVVYGFLLLTMLCMLNYILIGVFILCTLKIFKILEKMRKKLGFKYKTKDFAKFLKKENATVYSKMDFGIKLSWEKEGRWLEFIIETKDDTYEQMIADRRELMFK